MTARAFALQIGVGVAALVGLNAAVARLARNSVARQAVRAALATDPADVVALGNSTMAAGLDDAAYQAAGSRRVVNAAVGATDPVEHLALARAVRPRHPAATLLYGYFDTQLTDEPAGGYGTLVGNRALVYEFGPDLAGLYYAPSDPVARLGLLLAGRVPVLTERGTLWARVERVRRTLGGAGLPTVAESRFGRAGDFTLLEQDSTAFDLNCRSVVENRTPLSAPVEALLRLGPPGGFVAVEMPMPSNHRRTYTDTACYAAYRNHVTGLLRAAGARVIRADDWVSDDGFSDPLHLNESGAWAFSARLAVEPAR